MDINCIIINLNRCPEKRSRMEERMKKYPEIKYEFYDAIDGQKLTLDYMNDKKFAVLDEWLDPYHNRKTTKGEIGCTLSHYYVYEKAFEKEHEITLVLEDDAEFEDNFIEKLNHTINQLNKQKWDMCYLGRKKVNSDVIEEKVLGSDSLIYPDYSYWTVGYLINQRFCEKILNSNILKNIVVIDELLCIIGNISPFTNYNDKYNVNIDILSNEYCIIKPEESAFNYSDTEIITFLNNNLSELEIITVATDDNELLNRFKQSCKNYGLKYKILGLDREWCGGNMKEGPGGGMKLNLLKEHLKTYDDEKIILFSDSYDVIFLTDESEIMKKYETFECDIVFGGERECWPNQETSVFFDGEGPYKYINSGGFIGKVGTIKKILDMEIKDKDDDQYIIHQRYNIYKQLIKIDKKAEIFQTSSLDLNTNDIEILFKKNRIKNNIYNTFPCHYHGNGGKNTKIVFNNNCNYLLKTWNPTYNYCMPKIKDDTKKIYIFIYVPNNEKNISFFLRKIQELDYPKKNIYLKIFSNKEIKRDIFSEDYISVDILTYKEEERILRDNSLKECKKLNYDYYLNIDTVCNITNKNIIQELISYKKYIVCPLFKVHGKNWSNFWGDINEYGWYKTSFNYYRISENEEKGCWNVPYINNIYLIDANVLNDITDFYTKNYQSNRGCDMAFCENCYDKNILLYVCNENYYGNLTENIDNNEDKNENNIEEFIIDDNETLNEIIIKDNFLDEKTIEQLRGYGMTTEYKQKFRGGYKEHMFTSDFPIPELENVINIVKKSESEMFSNLEFSKGWFFIYDNECNGVTPHADGASINLNIWLTPNSSIKDSNKNGLIIWDKQKPQSWSFNEYNRDVKKIKKYLDDTNAKKQVIDYRYNRAIIFNSSNFHETNGVSMKEGHWNKRINLVFMFNRIKTKIGLFDYFNNKNLFIEKYFDKTFLDLLNDKKKDINEPITDVLQFPFVNDKFCEELILLCENYGKWSGATNKDSRIGYENVPSNDIHFTEIKFNTIWEDIIKTYIAPIVSRHWGSFKTNGINISFVVKYEDNKFYQLGPHHDSSSYTVNISLNEEYEGGEVNFIKKDKKIRNKKGHALIHPGRITHYHEGLPVTKGKKYICVSFVN